MALTIIKYEAKWQKRWDDFVLNDSINGTFLQTRNFLNYHPIGKFIDASLLFLQGSNIVAVIPACVTVENNKKSFFSHKGSTFGGIVLNKSKYNITTMEQLFLLLEEYLLNEGFEFAFIKNTSDIFTLEKGDLFDYFFYKNNYQIIDELNLYVDVENMGEEITQFWSPSNRRHYRASMKNSLQFREIIKNNELERFYSILLERLKSHGVTPVHRLQELEELSKVRFPNCIKFYGVFNEDLLIAGTMLFLFKHRVLHTQYLAHDTYYNQIYPMSFLIYNVLKFAKDDSFKKVSFGISTENCGKFLNKGLSIFKEGFGATYCNNHSYYKLLKK